MVVDHIDRVAYAARSNRTSPVALMRFCAQFGYEPMLFDAVDPAWPIYHTNVLMCIGTEFAMIGLSAITDPDRRAQVRRRIEETGRTVIDLSPAQVREFAGNAIELTGRDGRLLALSARAMRALDPAQLHVIGASATPMAVDVGAIELAGGSVRCMIAGVHLARRDEHPPVTPGPRALAGRRSERRPGHESRFPGPAGRNHFPPRASRDRARGTPRGTQQGGREHPDAPRRRRHDGLRPPVKPRIGVHLRRRRRPAGLLAGDRALAALTGFVASVRRKNPAVPIYLYGEQLSAVALPPPVLKEIHGFVNAFEDSADFVARGIARAAQDYLDGLAPPFFKALTDYARRGAYSWHAPGHSGGTAFLKSPVGTMFHEFFGENMLRADVCNAVEELGQLLDHTGPVHDAERNAARIFSADYLYFVTNGTSTSNKIVWSALVSPATSWWSTATATSRCCTP